MNHIKAEYSKLAAALKAAQDAKKALDGVIGDYRAALNVYIKEFLRDNPDLLEDVALAERNHEQASRDAEEAIEAFEDSVSGWALGEPPAASWQLDIHLPGVTVDPSTVVISSSQSELFMAALKYAPHLLRLDEEAANEFFKQHSYTIGRNVGDTRKMLPHLEGLFPFIGILPDPTVEIDEKTVIANINRYPNTEEAVSELKVAQEHADEIIEASTKKVTIAILGDVNGSNEDEDSGDSEDGYGDPYLPEDDATNLNSATNYADSVPPPDDQRKSRRDDKGDIPF